MKQLYDCTVLFATHKLVQFLEQAVELVVPEVEGLCVLPDIIPCKVSSRLLKVVHASIRLLMILQIEKVEVDIPIENPESYFKPDYPPRRTIKFFLQTEKEAVLRFNLKALGFSESAMEFPIILKKRSPGIVYCCVLVSYGFSPLSLSA